jgi:hypothetical protein
MAQPDPAAGPPALAAHLAGRYSCSSPDAGPQHAQLAQRFRELNVQAFQALAHDLYGIWKKVEKPGSARQETARAFAVANFRRLFAEQVLDEGGRLLADQPDSGEEAIASSVVAKLHAILRIREQTLARLPASFPQDLERAVRRGVALLREAARAVPPGVLLFPQRTLAAGAAGTVFDPLRDEPLPGCPTEGPLRLRMTVFPGYRVGGDGPILEKALVYTSE